ncbi:uncharacterized protein LOC135386893 [Ornithodoros turicata]|uniref:uncharacterized protein LOC135386893 n=1 Tax=Ornithodoros turicata TaxID=34597 RepID=UPI003139DFF4
MTLCVYQKAVVLVHFLRPSRKRVVKVAQLKTFMLSQASKLGAELERTSSCRHLRTHLSLYLPQCLGLPQLISQTYVIPHLVLTPNRCSLFAVCQLRRNEM